MNSWLIVGIAKSSNQAHIHTEPHARQKMHRLLAADRLGVAQNAKRAAHSVVQVALALLEQEIPRPTFIVDQHGHHFADLGEQFLFGSAQRDLIADLIEIAHRRRAFAVKSANGEADFLKAPQALSQIAE